VSGEGERERAGGALNKGELRLTHGARRGVHGVKVLRT
jgi:hypothetical protein